MKYTHYRHATGIIQYNNLEILLDPMLSPKESNPPIKKSWNDLKNPRVELPFDLNTFAPPNYCLVTHLHQDHFDAYAQKHLPNDIGLICQNENLSEFVKMGFTNISPISTELSIEGVKITRVPGQHGKSVIAQLMGTSSGYVFQSTGEPTLYITGDTIFYKDVKSTLQKYKPDIIIAFAGGAQFSYGDPITLTPEDVMSIHKYAPHAKIICIHMNSINHCRTTKQSLRDFLTSNLGSSISTDTFIIPKDGETIELI